MFILISYDEINSSFSKNTIVDGVDILGIDSDKDKLIKMGNEVEGYGEWEEKEDDELVKYAVYEVEDEDDEEESEQYLILKEVNV